MAPAVDIWY